MTPTRISPRDGYRLWAPTWDATPSPIVAVEERALQPWLDRITPHLAIDAGCGTGRWTAKIGAIGIDSSLAMLGIAAGKPGLRGHIAAADATLLPFADASADLVICTLTLGHLPDAAAAMREFARVLQAGGTLILTDFHPASALRGWRRTFRHQDRVYELENHPYTVSELRRACGNLALVESCDAFIGEPERRIFVEAGRLELFQAARAVPAVLLTRWMRL